MNLARHGGVFFMCFLHSPEVLLRTFLQANDDTRKVLNRKVRTMLDFEMIALILVLMGLMIALLHYLARL